MAPRATAGMTVSADPALARDLPAPVLSIDRVDKTFRSRGGEVHALAGISLEVARGEFVSLVGRSGCGKSTLLRLVAGLTPPTAGGLEIEGRRVEGPVGGIGMVFQTPVLLEWRDAFDNVMLPVEVLGTDRQAARQRATELLRLVGLAGFEHRRPFELSGGMQQRVAICRALVFDPPILLMDEPFAALDALTRDEMAGELLRIREQTGQTILFVTHNIDEAVLVSDRVVVMTPRPGRVRLIEPIDLPRPRTIEMRYDPRFIAHSHRIRSAVFEQD